MTLEISVMIKQDQMTPTGKWMTRSQIKNHLMATGFLRTLEIVVKMYEKERKQNFDVIRSMLKSFLEDNNAHEQNIQIIWQKC